MDRRSNKIKKVKANYDTSESSLADIPDRLQVKEEVVSEHEEDHFCEGDDQIETQVKIEVEKFCGVKKRNPGKKKAHLLLEFGRTSTDVGAEVIDVKAEKIEKKREREKLRMRGKRSTMSQEKKEGVLERAMLRMRRKRAIMSEEEKERKREQRRQYAREKRTRMKEEEKERQREIGRQYMREKRAKLTEDEKEMRKARDRAMKHDRRYKSKMTEAEKERRREQARLYQQRMRKNPEFLEKDRLRKYFQVQAYQSTLSVEEKEKLRLERLEKNRIWRNSLTGERKRRFQESLRKSCEKYQQKIKETQPQRWIHNVEKVNESQRERYATLTSEEKRRRLDQMKLYAAKRRLKKELERNGIPEDQVGRQLQELEDKMRQELNLGESGPRKPRGRKRKQTNCENFNTSEDIPPVLSPTTGLLRTRQDYDDDDDQANECFFELGSPIHSPKCDQSSDHISPYKRSPVPQSPPQYSPPSSPPTQTPTLSIVCHHCSVPVSFSSDADLRSHLGLEHLSKCWKCPKCKQIMLSSEEFAQHFKEVHINNQNKCSENEGGVSKPPTQQLHHHQPRFNFVCMRCKWGNDNPGGMFQTSQQLHAHVKQQHSKSFWPCAHCGLLKYSKQGLKIHWTLCWKRTEDS